MHRDPIGLRRLIESAGIRPELSRHIRVDLAPHNTGLGQHQQAVDEHFAAAVEALGEGFESAFTLDQLCPLAEVHIVQQRLVTQVIRLPRQQCGRQCVAHRANAYLQRPAVTHQRTGVQADQMILETHRHVGR
ncbi:hypothetical protein D3C73_702560 [compost metagenome]